MGLKWAYMRLRREGWRGPLVLKIFRGVPLFLEPEISSQAWTFFSQPGCSSTADWSKRSIFRKIHLEQLQSTFLTSLQNTSHMYACLISEYKSRVFISEHPTLHCTLIS